MLAAKSDVFCMIQNGSRRRQQIWYRGREDDRAHGIQGLHPARERGRAGGGRGDRGGLRGGGELGCDQPHYPPNRPGRGGPSFSEMRTGPILWGNLISDVLAFLITAAVVYFVVVVPMNRAMARTKSSEPPRQHTAGCPA